MLSYNHQNRNNMDQKNYIVLKAKKTYDLIIAIKNLIIRIFYNIYLDYNNLLVQCRYYLPTFNLI